MDEVEEEEVVVELDMEVMELRVVMETRDLEEIATLDIPEILDF